MSVFNLGYGLMRLALKDKRRKTQGPTKKYKIMMDVWRNAKHQQLQYDSLTAALSNQNRATSLAANRMRVGGTRRPNSL